MPQAVAASDLGAACPPIDAPAFDGNLSGSVRRFEDYSAGEKIDHADGVTVEEAEHMIAARLYQNVARVHFNQWSEAGGRFGRRLVYATAMSSRSPAP